MAKIPNLSPYRQNPKISLSAITLTTRLDCRWKLCSTLQSPIWLTFFPKKIKLLFKISLPSRGIFLCAYGGLKSWVQNFSVTDPLLISRCFALPRSNFTQELGVNQIVVPFQKEKNPTTVRCRLKNGQNPESEPLSPKSQNFTFGHNSAHKTRLPLKTL